MTNPYSDFAEGYARLIRDGKLIAMGGIEAAPRPALAPDAPKALIFGPHPDDECITGGLPLRLLREGGIRIVNVAVTQGSNKERQAPRWAELVNACRFLGFDCIQTIPGGLEKISPKGRASDPANWANAVGVVSAILRRERPKIVFLPHVGDWNGTHIGTHHLVVEAMRSVGGDFSCVTVETEFWAAMDTPNLMVESTTSDVADLVAAIAFHVGEVKRNPYHLTLPAWMQDNVRRGGEIVGGQGGSVPDFVFATLYRLRRWADGGWKDVLARGEFVGRNDLARLAKLAGW